MKLSFTVLLFSLGGVLFSQNDTALDIQYGSSFDAIPYSMDHAKIVVLVYFGVQIDQAKRKRVLHYINDEMFKGENEAPLSFMIGEDIEGNGIGCAAFIKGNRQINPFSEQRFFNLTEFKGRVPKIVGVYNLLFK